MYKICESNGKSLHVVYLFLYGIYTKLEPGIELPLPPALALFLVKCSVIEHVPAIIIYQLGLTDNVMLCSVAVSVCVCISVWLCRGGLWERLLDELRRSLQMSLE